MRRIKQAFGGQALFEHLESALQCAQPGILHMLHHQLQIAPRLVQRNARAQQNLHTILRTHSEQPDAWTKHGATHLCPAIFQREVQVPGSRACQIGYFALHPDQRQVGFNQVFQRIDQLADA